MPEKNKGKGAALKTGFQHCTGDVVVVQDADMEYDPQDLRSLLQPILDGIVMQCFKFAAHDAAFDRIETVYGMGYRWNPGDA